MSEDAESITIKPLSSAPNCAVAVPGSKSITNRALILAALADGRSTLTGALDSEDTRIMSAALRTLGIEVESRNEGETLIVSGRSGWIPKAGADLFMGNSGTSIRFLTALCTLGNGRFRLDGVDRMQRRPQADLIATLNQLGADVVSEQNTGCPPLLVNAHAGIDGGTAHLNAEASSQFLTALLMVAPYARQDVTIEIRGELRPFYVEITRRMMAQWGVDSDAEGTARFSVRAGQRYRPQASYAIEPDASSASYLFASAAITGGRVHVPNLSGAALQGDVRFATEVLAEMGCTVVDAVDGITVTGPPPGTLRGIDRDMSAISDTSLTLAAIAPFATTPTRVRNIAHARLQECDRIQAATTELRRLGVRVDEHPDGFTVYPASAIHAARIETYNDHRVAMSFALIGLLHPGITILNPGCVAKTFPDYWERLDLLRPSA